MNKNIKTFFIFFLGFCLPIIYLGIINLNKIEKEVMEIKTIVTFYSGRIGRKHLIKIKLIKRSDKFNGLLTNSFNKRNKITGSMYGNNIINLTEFERGKRAGSFLGKFVTNSEIIGLWSTPDGKMSSPFYLIKDPTFNKFNKLPSKIKDYKKN